MPSLGPPRPSSSALGQAGARPPPPELLTPAYILRTHAAQISALTFSDTSNYLYSGDIDGWVAVWNLKTFRPIFFWKAHEGGLLTLRDYAGGLLTHARDNKIHFYPFPASSTRSIRPGGAATATPTVARPLGLGRAWTMGVNAMAYCKMSLLLLTRDEGETGEGKGKGKEVEGLVAVPALTKDEMADVFHLPSLDRVHRSIGAGAFPIGDKTGTLMALELFLAPPSTPHAGTLHLLSAYEDGRVALHRFAGPAALAVSPIKSKREEGEDWVLEWEEKGHREAAMSLALAADRKSAWSVAADHFLCRYEMFGGVGEGEEGVRRMQVVESSAAGRAEVGVRDDGRLVAVAGWDGETRLYSAKTGAPLAVLSYHRSAIHALALSNVLPRSCADVDEEDDSDDSESEEEGGSAPRRRRAWLAMGGKDERISLWEVYPPGDELVKRN